MISTFDWEIYELCVDLQLSDDETNARMRIAHQLYPDERRQRYEMAIKIRTLPLEIRYMIVEYLKDLIRTQGPKIEKWLGQAIKEQYKNKLSDWQKIPQAYHYAHEICRGFCFACGEPNKDRMTAKYLSKGQRFKIPKMSIAIMIICFDCNIRGIRFCGLHQHIVWPEKMENRVTYNARLRSGRAKMLEKIENSS